MYQTLKNIKQKDWQYLLPALVCIFCFIATDILNLGNKVKFSYWSGNLLYEPYRIITSHFIHGDLQHLLANIFGIIVARFCLKSLKLNGDFFFLVLICLLIPTQTFILWASDIFLFNNPMSLAIGFSGIIYGIESFLLLSSIYGKEYFLFMEIGLRKNTQTRKLLTTLTILGCLWSLLPGISFAGHLGGFIAGTILFLI